MILLLLVLPLLLLLLPLLLLFLSGLCPLAFLLLVAPSVRTRQKHGGANANSRGGQCIVGSGGHGRRRLDSTDQEDE